MGWRQVAEQARQKVMGHESGQRPWKQTRKDQGERQPEGRQCWQMLCWVRWEVGAHSQVLTEGDK